MVNTVGQRQIQAELYTLVIKTWAMWAVLPYYSHIFMYLPAQQYD